MADWLLVAWEHEVTESHDEKIIGAIKYSDSLD